MTLQFCGSQESTLHTDLGKGDRYAVCEAIVLGIQ